MDLVKVAQQLADRADTIDGLHCFWHPTDRITPPAFEVELPDPIDYDGTYGRGMDSITLTANVVVGRSDDRSSAANILPYASGSGPKSIKAVLDSGEYTAMDTVHVRRCEFADFPIAGVMFRGAQFTIEITGKGDSP